VPTNVLGQRATATSPEESWTPLVARDHRQARLSRYELHAASEVGMTSSSLVTR
jgi:hypothetical protein